MPSDREQLPEENATGAAPQSVFPKVLPGAVLLLICLAVAVVAYAVGAARTRMVDSRQTLRELGVASPVHNRLDPRYRDADNDLVADAPLNTAELIDPDPVVFSFVPTRDPGHYQAVFADLLTHLQSRIGRPVIYQTFTSRQEQLRAIRDGRVHVAGVNTGNVPLAVNACGFVPVVAPGKPGDASPQQYVMRIIVPAASSIHSINDLRGRRLTFTEPTSNSGFKAPYVILANDFGMLPDRDYRIGFSHSHQASIHGVADGSLEAAAVASDLFNRLAGQGAIDPAAVRIIYESEPFPPVAIGFTHALEPDLARRIRAALLDFRFKGASLEAEFAPSGADRFVPVSYKNDYALIRRIDDAVGREHVLQD